MCDVKMSLLLLPHPLFSTKVLPDKSCDFPDTLARFARWPKFSVAEVEAPFNEKELLQSIDNLRKILTSFMFLKQ